MRAGGRWLVAAATLLLGFADLWRGGETLAPIALMAGYCVLIPWAILGGRTAAKDRVESATAGRPSYGVATGAALAVLALYVVTLAPGTAMWDTSEYIAAAYRLGFPHPPGNPFFVLIGRVFSILPIAPTVAQRINLLAAVSSACAAGFWFLVAERILSGWVADRRVRWAGAGAATLLGATAFTVWNQSVVNEKVYTIGLFFTALVSWLALRWLDQPEGERADRRLVLIGYLLGLGYANHMAGFLALPAVGVALAARRPQALLRWRVLLAVGAALVLGLTPFATQPIRAAHFPPINEGEMTGCRDGLKLSCTLSAETWNRFVFNFERKQYGKPPLLERQAPLTAQAGMWWLYFKWQWLRDPRGVNQPLQAVLAVLFLSLGAVGAVVHWRRDRATFWYFGPLMLSVTLALIFYMNFKYGFSQAPGLDLPVDAREVRDRDYFYIWSYSAWGIWAGIGLLWCWNEVRRAFAERPRVAQLFAAPVFALALVPLVGNWNAASRAGENFTREWAVDLLNSVEPYGILITGGDDDTFPLWYAQEVEGVRRDVTVGVTSLLGLDWYGRQLIRRPVPAYDAANGPAIYRATTWTRPEAPLVAMTLDEADQIPSFVELDGPKVFRKDSLSATITARYLTRDQILVLQMIKDSFPQRSIYISRGAGNYGSDMGLDPYLVTQGFVRKLMPSPVRASNDVIQVPGLGWWDIARTTALWSQVYHAQGSLLRQKRWIDPSSASIPYAYFVTSAVLGQALTQNGHAVEAARMVDSARAIAEVLGFAYPKPAEPGVNDSGR